MFLIERTASHSADVEAHAVIGSAELPDIRDKDRSDSTTSQAGAAGKIGCKLFMVLVNAS